MGFDYAAFKSVVDLLTGDWAEVPWDNLSALQHRFLYTLIEDKFAEVKETAIVVAAGRIDSLRMEFVASGDVAGKTSGGHGCLLKALYSGIMTYRPLWFEVDGGCKYFLVMNPEDFQYRLTESGLELQKEFPALGGIAFSHHFIPRATSPLPVEATVLREVPSDKARNAHLSVSDARIQPRLNDPPGHPDDEPGASIGKNAAKKTWFIAALQLDPNISDRKLAEKIGISRRTAASWRERYAGFLRVETPVHRPGGRKRSIESLGALASTKAIKKF